MAVTQTPTDPLQMATTVIVRLVASLDFSQCSERYFSVCQENATVQKSIRKHRKTQRQGSIADADSQRIVMCSTTQKYKSGFCVPSSSDHSSPLSSVHQFTAHLRHPVLPIHSFVSLSGNHISPLFLDNRQSSCWVFHNTGCTPQIATAHIT